MNEAAPVADIWADGVVMVWRLVMESTFKVPDGRITPDDI
jgi:hypothetical protein